jgi:hypothetical protein
MPVTIAHRSTAGRVLSMRKSPGAWLFNDASNGLKMDLLASGTIA